MAFSSQTVTFSPKKPASRVLTLSKTPPYEPPKAGLLSHLPISWVPYAELIRLDKPAGTAYLYFPCLFGTLLASCLIQPTPRPMQLLQTNLCLLLGAVIIRGASCTWNDILDRDIDRRVSRIQLRPMARRAVSVPSALSYLAAQVGIGLGLLHRFRPVCLFYMVPFIVVIGLCPLGKRFTHYPQVILSFAWAWGDIMGFPIMGISPFESSTVTKAAGCLYTSGIFWTVLYDMIYAHQDIQDDKKAGVMSIAVKHEKQAKLFLSGLALCQITMLVLVGYIINASPAFFLRTCCETVLIMGIMIAKVDLHEPENCMWWFKNGSWITGCATASGLLSEYMLRL